MKSSHPVICLTNHITSLRKSNFCSISKDGDNSLSPQHIKFCRSIIEDTAHLAGVVYLNDWYQVHRNDLQRCQQYSPIFKELLDAFGGSPMKVLQYSYPEKEWDISKFEHQEGKVCL